MFHKLERGAVAGALALALVAMAGCGGSGDGTVTSKPPDYHSALAGAPKSLARLYSDGDRLLGGGTQAFQTELDALRGYPIVVNKWASWCVPCRSEFPYLQRLSARFGKRVAFLGVDARDSAAAARTFLEEFPLPYPSYSDPDQSISRLLGATPGFPATAFYNPRGQRVFLRQGQYATQAELAADIRRYALGDRE
jgi:cytochrome c biogenesis protein CcmG, thiol:disulfide interchange protein DsbE